MRQDITKAMLALGCGGAMLVAGLGLGSMRVFAEPARQMQVVALGDETLGTADGTSTAGLVADYLGAGLQDHTTAGATTDDLLADLQSDGQLRQAVDQADVVLVSVGVNDLLDAVFYDNPALTDTTNQSTLIGLINAMPTSQAYAAVRHVLNTLPGTVTEINDNLTQITAQIQKLNPAANVVVQTVNNPIAIDFGQSDWASSVSQNRQLATAELYYYLDVCLQGGTYASSLLTDTEMTIPTGVNQAIGGLADVAVSDYYSAYVGAKGEIGLAFTLSHIADLNVAPTALGQVVMASAIIEADEQLSEGDGGVVTAAYDAAGQSLATLRGAMHQTITAAGANTTVTYIRGDVNGNGDVGIDDAYQTLQAYSQMSVGYASGLGPAQRCAADIDDDHEVGIQDAYQILLYYATNSAGGNPSWP